jgi:uncharacterized protein YjiS (DUF1127 family)
MIALPRHAFPTVAAGHVRPARRALADAVGLLAGWAERRRQRRALLWLDDAMLKDVGLGRGDAFREAAKPFWRG